MAAPRFRRRLGAVAAALLAATVLASVPGGTPASAATTSSEELIDTDGDGIGDRREFAGSHRYNTAVALAERFADDEAAISTVIVASGETQVDAAAAAGLAGHLRAPILLTRPDRLPHNVRRFIDNHSISRVVIVGGTAVVPDSIATAIEAIGSGPTVERVAGDDRYATAAAISARIGGRQPTWCGAKLPAAILVNGTDVGRGDAIAIGPLAYALGMPMLLTEARTLSRAAGAFLRAHDIGSVVIVGSDAAVSERIRTSLTDDFGVLTTRRIAGGTASATSVAVAREMRNACADELGTNLDMVALVNRGASADGVAAAPVLGRGLGAGGPVPVLLVGRSLPSPVRNFLASTPDYRSGRGSTHMGILAVGGTAVVPDAVIDQATAAAQTASGLTAVISVRVDPLTGKYETHTTGGITGGVFTVTFSDDVKHPLPIESLADSVLDPTIYRINGRPIAGVSPSGVSDEPITLVDRIALRDRTVSIRLSHPLEPGDTITVLGGGRVGAEGDLRRLARASLTLAKLTDAADVYHPFVDISAVAGPSEFRVLLTELNVAHNELTGPNWSRFIRVTGHSGRDIAVAAPPSLRSGPPGRSASILEYRVTTTAPLEVGDAIVVARNAVLDRRGNANAVSHVSVRAPLGAGSFGIGGVFVGNRRDDIRQASATITTAGANPVAKMRVTARRTGAAAGARGNEWSIFGYDLRPGADDAAKASRTNAVEIEVVTDAARKTVHYVISERTPLSDAGRVANLFDLASALHRDGLFRQNFEVDYVLAADGAKADESDSKQTALGAIASGRVDLSGGISAVAVRVEFNDAVQSLTPAEGLVADLVPLGSSGYVSSVGFDMLSDEVFISYWGPDAEVLPSTGTRAIIQHGRARNYFNVTGTDLSTLEGVGSARASFNGLRGDAGLEPEPRTAAQIDQLFG